MDSQPKPRDGHPRFYELLERMAELHARKNHDYAGGSDPLRNLRRCADAGIPPWKGVIVRLSDKFDRLITFAELEHYAVKNESVADTFLDMAVYALLGLILFEETAKPPTKQAHRSEDWHDLNLIPESIREFGKRP